MDAEEASSVYQGRYGEMPVPATLFATSSTALRSIDVTPSVPNSASNAAVVDRHNRRNGTVSTAGRQSYETPVPPMYNSPYSSKFQNWLMGPQVNYILNACLYRCGYPAATVMNGGRHNLALSTRVDQLATRTSGGPGKSVMTQSQRRFSRVQSIPRYSTMPKAYPTQGTAG